MPNFVGGGWVGNVREVRRRKEGLEIAVPGRPFVIKESPAGGKARRVKQVKREIDEERWSLFQVHGLGVTSIEEEIEKEEKVKSIVEILAEEGHIRVPRFIGVLRQT